VADPEHPDGSEPVPKLPRGRGIKLSGPEMFRIALTLAMLVTVLLLTKPCATAVSKFVTNFDQGSGSSAMPKPGNVDVPKPAADAAGSAYYEQLKPGMTDDEVRAAIERAKAHAAGSAASP
jgi:hypothetical protein